MSRSSGGLQKWNISRRTLSGSLSINTWPTAGQLTIIAYTVLTTNSELVFHKGVLLGDVSNAQGVTSLSLEKIIARRGETTVVIKKKNTLSLVTSEMGVASFVDVLVMPVGH
jgi:hypothetical protein